MAPTTPLWHHLLLLSTAASLASAGVPLQTSQQRVDNSYIVLFKEPGYSFNDHIATIDANFKARHQDLAALNGYSVENLKHPDLVRIQGDPKVEMVIENFTGEDNDDNETVDCDLASEKRDLEPGRTQSGAGWGLTWTSADDQNKTLTYGSQSKYSYVHEAGAGVDVYLIDTGIHVDIFNRTGEFDHVNQEDYSKFNGRAHRKGTWVFGDDGVGDDTGHGTKVASIIGGVEYGVAKYATIHSVKIRQEGFPRADHFLKALGEITKTHNSKKNSTNFRGSIVNLSEDMSILGNQNENLTTLFDKTMTDAHNAGIVLVTPSGNKGYDNATWPANHAHVISVGAMTPEYKPWVVDASTGSNFGAENVDIWAPGARAKALIDESADKKCVTGTSYAAAHVSGLLAIYFGAESGNDMDAKLSATQARDRLMDNTYKGRVALPDKSYPEHDEEYKSSTQQMASSRYVWGQKHEPKLAYKDGPEVEADPKCPAAPADSSQNEVRAANGAYGGVEPFRRRFAPFYPRAESSGGTTTTPTSTGTAPIGTRTAVGTGTTIVGTAASEQVPPVGAGQVVCGAARPVGA